MKFFLEKLIAIKIPGFVSLSTFAKHECCLFFLYDVKGELQRQNKLISSERPFKILQNETKIIKIGHAVLEIFNFKD